MNLDTFSGSDSMLNFYSISSMAFSPNIIIFTYFSLITFLSYYDINGRFSSSSSMGLLYS